MPTVQLLASDNSVYRQTTSSQSDIEKAYTDTSSTTYARVNVTNASNDYLRLKGFNFSQIPSDAIVTNMTFKIKVAVESSNQTLTISLKNGSTDISDVVTTNATTATVYTLTPTVSFGNIVSYGDSFSFNISGSRTGYYYPYGVEVNVTYVVSSNKNKIVYNGTTLIDLTEDTATAEDVALGKIFHLANGLIATGTASSLEYETGTWSPSSNTTRGTVSFAKTHSKPPTFVLMADSSATTTSTDPATYSAMVWGYADFWRVFGHALSVGGGAYNSHTSMIYGAFRTTSTDWSTTVGIAYTSPSLITQNSDTTSSNLGVTYSRYYVDESAFYPYMAFATSSSTQLNWRSTRSYDWIAIWT